MPRGVHAKDQTAFRLDPDLRARLKARAEEEGVTMTDYVSEAIEEKLARDITTRTAAATFRSHALTCKCGTCKPPKESKR